MTPEQKALAKREYKEQTHPKGVFRVHCAATGQNWVDASTTLDTIQNRIWFMLRMGSFHTRDLQRAWTEAGPDALTFEVLETFPEDASDLAVERLIKERTAHWRDAFDAAPCL